MGSESRVGGASDEGCSVHPKVVVGRVPVLVRTLVLGTHSLARGLHFEQLEDELRTQTLEFRFLLFLRCDLSGFQTLLR